MKQAILLLLLSSLPAWADLAPRNEAMKLLASKNYQQAHDRFVEMANQRSTPLSKADALSKAAFCLHRMNRTEEAMELARTIKLLPFSVFCQMQLLKEEGKWKEVLALVKAENLESWPEKLIYPASMLVGEASLALGNPEKAAAAFLTANRYTIVPQQKALGFISLGDAYRSGQPQKALEAYGEAVRLATRSGGVLPKALVARAKLQAVSGHKEEALADLVQLQAAAGKDPYWQCAVPLTSGEVYEAVGSREEAIASYQKALAVPDAPEDLLRKARTQIAALEAK